MLKTTPRIPIVPPRPLVGVPKKKKKNMFKCDFKECQKVMTTKFSLMRHI